MTEMNDSSLTEYETGPETESDSFEDFAEPDDFSEDIEIIEETVDIDDPGLGEEFEEVPDLVPEDELAEYPAEELSEAFDADESFEDQADIGEEIEIMEESDEAGEFVLDEDFEDLPDIDAANETEESLEESEIQKEELSESFDADEVFEEPAETDEELEVMEESDDTGAFVLDEEFEDLPDIDAENEPEELSEDVKEDIEITEEADISGSPESDDEFEEVPDIEKEALEDPAEETEVFDEEVIPDEVSEETDDDFEEPAETEVNTARQELSEYMNAHNYGIADRSEYMNDPEWRRLTNNDLIERGLKPLDTSEVSEEQTEGIRRELIGRGIPEDSSELEAILENERTWMEKADDGVEDKTETLEESMDVTGIAEETEQTSFTEPVVEQQTITEELENESSAHTDELAQVFEQTDIPVPDDKNMLDSNGEMTGREFPEDTIVLQDIPKNDDMEEVPDAEEMLPESEDIYMDQNDMEQSIETVENIYDSCHFAGFETGKLENGMDVIKGNHFDQYLDDYYHSEDLTRESLRGREYIETVSTADIEGVHLGQYDMKNANNFWNMHSSNYEFYRDAAAHIPEVQKALDEGAALEDLQNNERLKNCINMYFNPEIMPVVEKIDDYYTFNGNGRHRIIAARQYGYNIPVKVTGIRSRKD